MGAVTFSIDPKILDLLSKNMELDVFVETGTFEGSSTETAKKYFKEVFSVELADEYYQKAKQRFSHDNHVKILHDSSAAALRNLQNQIADRNTVFWLDAHWCIANNTAGETSQCPLIEELDAIHTLNNNSVLLIDDARFFLSPPAYPHEIAQWPSFSTVFRKLQTLNSRHDFRVINDCIIFFPPHLSAAIDDYGYHHGIDWNHVFQKANALDECEKDRADRLVVINNLTDHINDLQKTKLRKIIKAFLGIIHA